MAVRLVIFEQVCRPIKLYFTYVAIQPICKGTLVIYIAHASKPVVNIKVSVKILYTLHRSFLASNIPLLYENSIVKSKIEISSVTVEQNISDLHAYILVKNKRLLFKSLQSTYKTKLPY